MERFGRRRRRRREEDRREGGRKRTWKSFGTPPPDIPHDNVLSVLLMDHDLERSEEEDEWDGVEEGVG